MVYLKLVDNKETSGTVIQVYTDGSCHPPSGTGAWAAMLLAESEKILLSGSEQATTHQKMELTAAVEAIRRIDALGWGSRKIIVYTDSQYLAGLSGRKDKLLSTRFRNRKNMPLPNRELVISLLNYRSNFSIEFIKVAAHERVSDVVNYNREVDKLSRKIVRHLVSNQ